MTTMVHISRRHYDQHIVDYLNREMAAAHEQRAANDAWLRGSGIRDTIAYQQSCDNTGWDN